MRWIVWTYCICLALSSCYVQAFAVEDDKQAASGGINTAFSPALGSARIAVLRFLPLPLKRTDGWVLHERVFTDEFYSDNPAASDIYGKFSPKDYNRIVNQMIRSVAKWQGLNVQIVDSIEELGAAQWNLIIFGAVSELAVGRNAAVSFNIRLVDGKTLQTIEQTRISESQRIEGIPLIANLPIHMIGHHANNFHPQRTILNYATYLCVNRMFHLADRKIRE